MDIDDGITERERLRIIAASRGREISPGRWRNFCADPRCCMPIEVSAEWMRFKTDILCDECRPRIQKGNAVSAAFSPYKERH